MPLEINYCNLRGHESMLRDSVRCEAFRQAIVDTVTPGCAVLDIGAGTGILSLFAAQAGARVVYAVERTHIAEFAKRIVSENGFGDRINVLQNDMETLELPEKVDVIVSEWLGGYGVDENLLPIVVRARDRWLKPGGKLLPASVAVMFAPIDDKELYNEHGPGFWNKRNIHGIDFSFFTQKELQMGHANQLHVPDKFLLAPGKSIHHLKTDGAHPGDEWCSGTVEYEIQRDGDGSWFRVVLRACRWRSIMVRADREGLSGRLGHLISHPECWVWASE